MAVFCDGPFAKALPSTAGGYNSEGSTAPCLSESRLGGGMGQLAVPKLGLSMNWVSLGG